MGLGRCPPKSDTNPLTLPEHLCYAPHRSNTNPTISRRNHNPGKPTRPTRGLNASAHPNGPTKDPRLKQKSPSPLPPGPVPLPPISRRWNVHRLYAAGPVQGPCRFNAPITGCVYPGPLRAGFPGKSTDPRFSKALVSLFVPPSLPSVYPADAPGRRF